MVRSLNKETSITLVLDIIRRYGPINRYEIAKRTSLSPATITNITDKLIKTGFICEIPATTSKRGRKPINLTLSNKNYLSIGIEIDSRHITGIIIGLSGDVVKKDIVNVDDSTPEVMFKRSIELYNSLIKGLDKKNIIGLGIGIPGLIDSRNKKVLFSAVLGWRDVSVDKFLRGIDIPVFIEDNVRAITLGELWYGAGIGRDNLLCIGAGRGISAGIVINGSIYSGPNDRAGEFGHIVIEKDGRKCKCGNYGCLEAYVSTETIIEKVLEGLKNNAYTDFNPKNKDKLFEEIIHTGKTGDKFILNIFEEVGEYLGIGIANLINLFNPELIILADELAKAGDLILEPVKRTIKLHALPPIPEIVISILGPLACAIGSATLPIKELLYSRLDTYVLGGDIGKDNLDFNNNSNSITRS